MQGASFRGILSVIGGKPVMTPPSLNSLLVSQKLRFRNRRQQLSGKSLPDEPGEKLCQRDDVLSYTGLLESAQLDVPR